MNPGNPEEGASGSKRGSIPSNYRFSSASTRNKKVPKSTHSSAAESSDFTSKKVAEAKEVMKEWLIPTMQEYPFTTLLQKFGPDPLSKLDGDNSPNLAELARSLGLRIDGRDPLLVGDRWVGWPTQTDTEREEKISNVLNNIGLALAKLTGLTKKREYSSRFNKNYPKGGRKLKPDLVVVPVAESAGSGGEPNDWLSFVAFGEIKFDKKGNNNDVLAGLANYVYETLTFQDNRDWMLALAFKHSNLVMYLYDRSGVVRSTPIDIHKEKEDFLRIAIGVLFAEDKDLGLDTSVKTRDGKRYVTVKQIDDDEVELEILKTVFRSKSIVGRGTTIRLCSGRLKSDEDKEGNELRKYIVKDSWVDEDDEINEYNILQKLKGFPNVPCMYSFQQISGDGTGTERFRPKEEQVEQARTPNWRKYGKTAFNPRKHHRIVLSAAAQPISDFKTPKELVIAFRDIFIAIIDLKMEKEILHRDISDSNIMLVDAGDGQRAGCLIGFEHAVDLLDENVLETVKQRTGTTLFMAADVLKNKSDFVHNYHHDLESAFYSLICVCLDRCRVALDLWGPTNSEEGMNASALIKQTFSESTNVFRAGFLAKLSPELIKLKDYFLELKSLIHVSMNTNDAERNILTDRNDILCIHARALAKLEAIETGQHLDEASPEEAASLASTSRQSGSGERPRIPDVIPSTGGASNSSDVHSSGASRLALTSYSSEGSPAEQTYLCTPEERSLLDPPVGQKRKQRPDGQP